MIWETGYLMLKTREALETSSVINVTGLNFEPFENQLNPLKGTLD